jgi:hypothetical protein
MAAQVPHGFTVHARWGVLSGKEGDFVVKNFTDRDVAYPMFDKYRRKSLRHKARILC